MYKFTIIIPHKNIPNLLRRCLDSIPHRDDVQIIVVDDNSDADKVDFAQFPGLNEKNTEVYFTKEGRGAGYARNVGLSHAKGEWVLFADADDMFLPEIEKVFEYCEGSDIELIFFGTSAIELETLKDCSESGYVSFINRELLIANNRKEPNLLRYKIETPWGKSVKKSFLDKCGIRFEEVSFANDTRFSALCDFYATSIAICPHKAYCYSIRNNSLWNKKDLKWAKVRCGVVLRMAEFMKEHGENEKKDMYCTKARHFLLEIRKYSISSFIWYVFLYLKVAGFRFEYIKIAVRHLGRLAKITQ